MSGEIAQEALAQLFVLALVFGFVAGAIYDVFRIRRIAINIPILWHFEDFFFMLACAVCFCVFFFVQSSGKVRGFAFAAAIAGLLIYRYTLGRLVIRCAEKIISFVKRLVRRLLLPPIRFVKRILRAVWKRISGALRRVWLRYARRRSERFLSDFERSVLVGFSGNSRSQKERKNIKTSAKRPKRISRKKKGRKREGKRNEKK